MSMSSAVKKYPKYYYKHPLTRHSGKNAPIETQRVYPVLSAEQLLSQRGRRKVVDQIRVTCGAPHEHYNALYQQLMDNFAEFIQNLPMANNHRMRRLDKQLHLASLALSLREPYLLAGEILNRTTDEQKALWNYVIFSGMLLGRLGQLVTQYNVSICDERGIFVKHWEPFLGPMNAQGSHYKIRDITHQSSPMDSQLNALIARQLMPEDGYHWIASVPEALEQWLLALDSTGEREPFSLVARVYVELESFLSKQQKFLEAEAEEIFEKYLEELLDDRIFDEDENAEFTNYIGSEPAETLVGERFYQWLRNGIQDKSLTVNQQDSAVFMTQQGALLLHPEVFDKFLKTNPNAGKPQEVFDQFSKLGLVANSNLQNYVQKFPGLREQNVQGVVLKDTKALFGPYVPPPLSPYFLKSNVVKVLDADRIIHNVLREKEFNKEKKEVVQAKAEAKEKEQSMYPKLKSEADKASYKDFSLTNKPPMKR
jgi:hypothetical protein